MRTVLGNIGKLAALKPTPDTPDNELTVNSIIDAKVIYGSPRTVADKLLALREQAGPFGTLLVTGVDWSGPNAEWERESLTLLASDVMPMVRAEAGAELVPAQ